VTASETVEFAQTSVDQIQRGLAAVQENLEVIDDVAVAAEQLVEQVRRRSKYVFIVGGSVALCAVVAVVVFKRRKRHRSAEEQQG
jgi:CHASE3 domain sensor protein